jgi:hypothetical protein
MHLRNEILANERRRHGKFVLHAVFVDIHPAKLVGVGDTVPDEIVAAMAGPLVVV